MNFVNDERHDGLITPPPRCRYVSATTPPPPPQPRKTRDLFEHVDMDCEVPDFDDELSFSPTLADAPRLPTLNGIPPICDGHHLTPTIRPRATGRRISLLLPQDHDMPPAWLAELHKENNHTLPLIPMNLDEEFRATSSANKNFDLNRPILTRRNVTFKSAGARCA